MSPATSSVRSPELTSISLPSIVKLSTTTPALAVTVPAKVLAFPVIVKILLPVPEPVLRLITSASPCAQMFNSPSESKSIIPNSEPLLKRMC